MKAIRGCSLVRVTMVKIGPMWVVVGHGSVIVLVRMSMRRLLVGMVVFVMAIIVAMSVSMR